MAGKKRRRRKATAHRRRRVTVHANAPKRRHHKRRYRRNGSGMLGRGLVGKVTGIVKDGVIGGVSVVAGEATSRLVRSRVLGMAAGETMSSVAEAGIAVASGLVLERFAGREIARDFVKGGFAGVIRGTIKQLAGGHPLVTEALSDSGPRIIRRGGSRRLGSYVRPSLGAFVRPGLDQQMVDLGYQS